MDEFIGGNVVILYLDCDGDYISTYVFQNVQDCRLNDWIFTMWKLYLFRENITMKTYTCLSINSKVKKNNGSQYYMV